MSSRPWRAWFGETRTLEQQLTGLDPLFERVKGRSVLDVGCAEGEISHECARQGARSAYGFDTLPKFIARARTRGAGLNCVFIEADANKWTPGPEERYDVVLLLGVLHKLRQPRESCMRIAACARELVVIRLDPREAPDIVDPRSHNRRVSIQFAMQDAGFKLTRKTDGPIAELGVPEWVGYFERHHGSDS